MRPVEQEAAGWRPTSAGTWGHWVNPGSPKASVSDLRLALLQNLISRSSVMKKNSSMKFGIKSFI